jgi:hypothetical protein
MKAKKKKKKVSQIPCTHWVVPVEQLKGSDELFVTLPPELLRAVDWKKGDVIIWSPDKDGYLLTKVEKH